MAQTRLTYALVSGCDTNIFYTFHSTCFPRLEMDLRLIARWINLGGNAIGQPPGNSALTVGDLRDYSVLNLIPGSTQRSLRALSQPIKTPTAIMTLTTTNFATV